MREEQAGFGAGQSCTDQIAILQITVEQSIKWQFSLYINVIDFEKAFNIISREVLWRLLQYYRMPVKVVTIIRALYKGGTQWTKDPTIEYEYWSTTRLPAISPAVSGRPGLGDEESL